MLCKKKRNISVVTNRNSRNIENFFNECPRKED